MDSWQEFLELGRSRGWFWPENRSFLTSLVGEEKSKKIPIEPRRHNTPALEGSTIDSHLESEGDEEEQSLNKDEVSIGPNGEEGADTDSDADHVDDADHADHADHHADDADAAGGVKEVEVDLEDSDDATEGSVSEGEDSDDEVSDEEENSDTDTNTATEASDGDEASETSELSGASEASEEASEASEAYDTEEEVGDEEEASGDENDKPNIVLVSPALVENDGDGEVEVEIEASLLDQTEVSLPNQAEAFLRDQVETLLPDQNDEPPAIDEPESNVELDESVDCWDEMDSDDDEDDEHDRLQSLMLQEMMQMRQQRWAEQIQQPNNEEEDQLEQTAKEGTVEDLSSQLASMAIKRTQSTPPQYHEEEEEEEEEQGDEDLVLEAECVASDDAGEVEVEGFELNYEDEALVEVVQKKPLPSTVKDSDEETVLPLSTTPQPPVPQQPSPDQPSTTSQQPPTFSQQPAKQQDELDSPQIKVAKRRAGRVVVVDSDEDVPPPTHKPNHKPHPKIITISDSDSDKENQPSSINRPHQRISKRESIAPQQPSRTKLILQSARKGFQSSGSDTDSGKDSEGCGDWIQSDEERSGDDEDCDMSGFVVPDDEMEEDNFDDQEYDDGEGSERALSDEEEDEEDEEDEGVDWSEESDGEDGYPLPVISARTPSVPTRTPSVPTRTPSAPTRTPSKVQTPKRTFYALKSTPKHPAILPKTPQTSKKRNFDLQIVRELYDEFNKEVFGNRLPEDLPITWSVTLRTTAGYCKNKLVNGTRTASIDLALKVLDDMERLRATLVHEMCHAAVWLIDNASPRGAPHGQLFYAWGNRVERVYPDLTVSTCHNYEIACKYTYVCTNPSCTAKVGRHSKSLNTAKKVCRRCGSQFKLAPRVLKDGTPARAVTPSAFSSFLKDNLGRTKKENPSTPHKDVMAILVAKYNEMKIAK